MWSFPPAKAPKSQLVVEQSSKGGSGTYQKRYPMSKDKEEAAPRGKIAIKSNPITTGWMTHKMENNDIKEVLLLL